MSENSLYQQALLAHHQNPFGFQLSLPFTHTEEGENPACGDEITLYVQLENQTIKGLAFDGDSCAICRASASILCKQHSGIELSSLKLALANTLTAIENGEHMTAELAPLNSIHAFPIRRQCALLPWQTLAQVIAKVEQA